MGEKEKGRSPRKRGDPFRTGREGEGGVMKIYENKGGEGARE